MADIGHELTEERIKEIEKELQQEYTRAAKEIKKKLDDYMHRFEIKDEKWQQWVEEGKKTQEEYEQWRIGQLAVGERWEKMKDTIADDLMHTNEIAGRIAEGRMPEIFSTNANYSLYQVEHDARIDTGLTLYNRDAVNRIVRDRPQLFLPPGKALSQQIAEGKVKRWEKGKIQSEMLQGIMQGESIPTIARRIAEKTSGSEYKAAVRNARTMSTNAQNAGRYDAYNRLTRRGVDLTLEWAATLDNRTRHSHRMMHGQRRDVGEPFEVDGVKIMYPAQTGKFMAVSSVPQEMLWNCRCTILAYVKGFEHDTIKESDKMGDMTFDEWLEAKEQPQPILSQKEKGDAISAQYRKEYAGKNVGPARPLGSGYTSEPDHGPEPMPAQASKKKGNFDGIGNATKEQASEDWFEYEYASAMAEYIETRKMPKFDINGMEIHDDVRERLAHEANLIQEVGSKTNTKQKTLYRGAVLSEEDARAFTPGETYTTKTLTATTPNRKVADIYTDVENYGGGEGVPVIFEFQKPDGIFGFKRDDNETVLPGGEEFRIVKNYMDEDGVIHIGFYAKKGRKGGNRGHKG